MQPAGSSQGMSGFVGAPRLEPVPRRRVRICGGITAGALLKEGRTTAE
jgi:hypothetical protein